MKEPKRDDVVALRAQVEGVEFGVVPGEFLRVAVPVPACIHQRRQRGGRPRVEDVLLGREFVVAAVGTLLDGRVVREGVDRQVLAASEYRVATLVAVPHRDRDARVALPGDTPVPL